MSDIENKLNDIAFGAIAALLSAESPRQTTMGDAPPLNDPGLTLQDGQKSAPDIAGLLGDNPFGGDIKSRLITYAPEYSLEPDSMLQIRAEHLFDIFLKDLNEKPADEETQAALGKAVRVTLLEKWLIKNKGMRPFVACIRALALEGNIPQDENQPPTIEAL